MVVATKLFWALGYNQVETFLTTFDPTAGRHRSEGARSGGRPASARRSRRDDLDEVLERARAERRRHLPRRGGAPADRARSSAPFRYEGTRPDDPNDIVPHEHRRELRALRVFGAWTNLTDLKAGNTLDTLVTENGRGVVKHYLQDVGSTFGMGANGPHDWDEGLEYFYEGDAVAQAAVHVRVRAEPVADRAATAITPSVGRFEGDRFDPTTWKPHTPTTAYIEMRADDAFWAARRVMAFSDELIRAGVKTGQFSEPAAEEYLADVLIKRRDAIGRAYLTAVNPSSTRARRRGAADVRQRRGAVGLAEAPESYTAAWFAFDNATGATRAARRDAGARPDAPGAAGPAGRRGRVRAGRVCAPMSAAHPAWAQPVVMLFPARAARLEAGRPRAPCPTDRHRPPRPGPPRRSRDGARGRPRNRRATTWVERAAVADRRRAARRGRQRRC